MIAQEAEGHAHDQETGADRGAGKGPDPTQETDPGANHRVQDAAGQEAEAQVHEGAEVTVAVQTGMGIDQDPSPDLEADQSLALSPQTEMIKDRRSPGLYHCDGLQT